MYLLWYVESRNKRQIIERVKKVDNETSKENDRDENNAIENDNVIANDNDREINDKQAKSRKNTLDANKRRDISRELWNLINVDVKDDYHWEFYLKFFDDVEVDEKRSIKFERSKSNSYYSNCYLEKALSIKTHESLNTKNSRNLRKRSWFRDQLKT